jgi:hypothetical protein
MAILYFHVWAKIKKNDKKSCGKLIVSSPFEMKTVDIHLLYEEIAFPAA